MPEGTLTGWLDLPAGLGGDFGGASLHITSVLDGVDAGWTDLTVAMLSPDDGTVLTGTVITRTDCGAGQGGGFRSVWTDSAKLFVIEMWTIRGEVTMS